MLIIISQKMLYLFNSPSMWNFQPLGQKCNFKSCNSRQRKKFIKFFLGVYRIYGEGQGDSCVRLNRSKVALTLEDLRTYCGYNWLARTILKYHTFRNFMAYEFVVFQKNAYLEIQERVATSPMQDVGKKKLKKLSSWQS